MEYAGEGRFGNLSKDFKQGSDDGIWRQTCTD